MNTKHKQKLKARLSQKSNIAPLTNNDIQLPYRKKLSHPNMFLGQSNIHLKQQNNLLMKTKQENALNQKIKDVLHCKQSSFQFKSNEVNKRQKCSRIKFSRLNYLKKRIENINMNAKIDNCFNTINKKKSLTVKTKSQNQEAELSNHRKCYSQISNDRKYSTNRTVNGQKRSDNLSALIIELKQVVKVKGRRYFFKEMLNKTTNFNNDGLQNTSCSVNAYLENQLQPQKHHMLNRSLYTIRIQDSFYSPLKNQQIHSTNDKTIEAKSKTIDWDDDLLRFKTEPNSQGIQQIYELIL